MGEWEQEGFEKYIMENTILDSMCCCVLIHSRSVDIIDNAWHLFSLPIIKGSQGGILREELEAFSHQTKCNGQTNGLKAKCCGPDNLHPGT